MFFIYIVFDFEWVYWVYIEERKYMSVYLHFNRVISTTDVVVDQRDLCGQANAEWFRVWRS